MATFPSLSRGEDLKHFVEKLAYNPAIQSQMEDGKVISRGRFTKTKKMWEINYTFLTDADKTLLETLQETVNVSGDVFDWTHPKTSVVYSVRFKEPINFFVEPTDSDKWAASFTLIEA